MVEIESVAVPTGYACARIYRDTPLAIATFHAARITRFRAAHRREHVAVRSNREHRAVTIEPNFPSAFMDESVMMPTQLDEVGQVIATEVRPVVDVVNVREDTGSASGKSTTLVASPHRPARR